MMTSSWDVNDALNSVESREEIRQELLAAINVDDRVLSAAATPTPTAASTPYVVKPGRPIHGSVCNHSLLDEST